MRFGPLQQGASNTSAGAAGVNRNLLNVQELVHRPGNQVGHRLVGRVDRHPCQSGPPEPVQLTDWHGVVVGYLRHANVGEASPGGTLDLLQPHQLARGDGPDTLPQIRGLAAVHKFSVPRAARTGA